MDSTTATLTARTSSVSHPAIFAEDDIVIRTSDRLADLGSLIVNFEGADFGTLASLHMSPNAVRILIDALVSLEVAP